MIPSSKALCLEYVFWYQEDSASPKRLVVPGSLIQTVFRGLHEQLVDASGKQ